MLKIRTHIMRWSLLIIPLLGGVFISINQVNGQTEQISPTIQGEIWYVSTTGANANIRACKSEESCDVVATVPNQSPVLVVATSTSWYTILLADGTTGYISRFLLNRESPFVESCDQIAVSITQDIQIPDAVVPTEKPCVEMQAMDNAQLGENVGEISIQSGDIWTYVGQASEILNLRVQADKPANTASDRGIVENGLLDTLLLIYTPDGSLLTINNDIVPRTVTNSLIEGFVLPEYGVYRIEIRSVDDASEGEYKLIIESSHQYGGNPPPTSSPYPSLMPTATFPLSNNGNPPPHPTPTFPPAVIVTPGG